MTSASKKTKGLSPGDTLLCWSQSSFYNYGKHLIYLGPDANNEHNVLVASKSECFEIITLDELSPNCYRRIGRYNILNENYYKNGKIKDITIRYYDKKQVIDVRVFLNKKEFKIEDLKAIPSWIN